MLFNYLQNFHGALLGAYAAGYAFAGEGIGIGLDHDAHRAGGNAFAALSAELFVYHVHALGILGDSSGGADLGTFAALNAGLDHRGTVFLLTQCYAREVGVELLIKCGRAGNHTLQTCVAGRLVLYFQLFHDCDNLQYFSDKNTRKLAKTHQ